ncbi:MAG: hypothetical protein V7776_19565 [Halopseudomonas aestusnigri]
MKAEGKNPNELLHHQIKYLNNQLEGGPGIQKLLIMPALGFKTIKTPYAITKEFEIMGYLKESISDYGLRRSMIWYD